MKRLNKTNIEWSRKVSSIDQLEEIYGKPNPASLIKEIDFISEKCLPGKAKKFGALCLIVVSRVSLS